MSKRAVYAAIARFGGKDAGHVCYGRTKDEARLIARRTTTMSVVIRRELYTEEQTAALVAVGKLLPLKNPAAMALGSIRSPRKAESSRRNARLGGVLGGRPPRQPYQTRFIGAPYGDEGETGPTVATLREADTLAKRDLCPGQRLQVLRGGKVIAEWSCSHEFGTTRVVC